jgi:hypothetical protein
MRLAALASAAVFAAAAFCAVTSASAPCLAQTAAADVPPDVIRLKDGAVYRGTILEYLPGDYLVMQTASGETKRFALADVVSMSAGTTTGSVDLSAAQPLATVRAQATPLHFVAPSPGTDLFIRTSESTVGGIAWGQAPSVYSGTVRMYEHICAAPCDATLPAGQHRLALAYRGGDPVEADGAVTLSGPATVTGTYLDRRGVRTAGWVVLGATLGAGALTLIASATVTTKESCPPEVSPCSAQSAPNVAVLTAGIAVMAVGTLVGMILVSQGDGAVVEVTPATQGLGPLTHRREADVRVGPFELAGPGLTARF